jgi:hypothetical protein
MEALQIGCAIEVGISDKFEQVLTVEPRELRARSG